MIKLRDWDRLYVHNFNWALRMLEDKEEGWLEAILAFNVFQKDLFRLYGVTYTSGDKFKKQCIKGLDLTPEQLFEITHKYINSAGNYTTKMFIFHWWNDLRYYILGAEPFLGTVWEYYKPATKEEIEQARKDFGHIEEIWMGKKLEHDHTFNDDAVVLDYRGMRLIIDNEWACAWLKDKNGVHSFGLDWDWWFPIDEYLDLGE